MTRQRDWTTPAIRAQSLTKFYGSHRGVEKLAISVVLVFDTRDLT